MADMGFMPQVEWVLRHIQGGHQTPAVLGHARRRDPGPGRPLPARPVFHEVGSPTQTVDKMAHRFLLVHEMDKHRVAAAISRSGSHCLVFTNTKRAADRLARQLDDVGVDAKAIHGDLRQEVRERALKRFSDGKLAVLVATDVAARGLDIDELDIVIQADPPPDPKTYLHRAGRTARAGAAGLAVTLVLWNEELEVRRLKRRLGPRRADRRDVLERRAPRRPHLLEPGRRGRRVADAPRQPPSGQIRANARAHSSEVSERPSVRAPSAIEPAHVVDRHPLDPLALADVAGVTLVGGAVGEEHVEDLVGRAVARRTTPRRVSGPGRQPVSSSVSRRRPARASRRARCGRPGSPSPTCR